MDEVPICLESALLSVPSYHFLAILSIKMYKIVDSVSCFPYNSAKYELRITSQFWQIEGVEVKNRILPEFKSFLVSRSLVPEKNVSFHAHWVIWVRKLD